ncbi:hypothetical protein [Thalassospira sp. TSL5-1]|uniref:hypothetical protein n=1 Tax=Thalassospira sp. TSL5-1 TaxID=1544451 RepID=UPI00093EA8F8|nr:hypothetical protein [Thalassospira sp. TSL5-1]OKH86849.1 hypothetical protein LF95_20855 [Thalassospira sp. TSL5-1]
MTKLRPEFMMRLDTAINLLPNIKPRLARQELKEIHSILCGKRLEQTDEEIDPKIVVAGKNSQVEVSFSQSCEFFENEEYGAARITPAAAKVLALLYNAGIFKLQKSNSLIEATSALDDYARSEPVLREAQAVADAQAMTEKETYNNLLDNPDLITQDKFSYPLLDAVFWKHKGPGTHTMQIGGFEVTKRVHTFTSNTGKNRDSEVVISWVDQNGVKRLFKKSSRYSGNRRNNPDKNWGLHE